MLNEVTKTVDFDVDSFTLKFADDVDINEVLELWELCNEHNDDLKYMLDNPRGSLVIVGLYDSDKLIGYGLCESVVDINEAEQRWLSKYKLTVDFLTEANFMTGSGIHPDYSGKGLQKRLILARDEIAASRGCASSNAVMLNTELASIKNYLACGYSLVAEREINSCGTLCIFRKELGVVAAQS